MLAFPFLCKNPAVFAGKNPRILFMAKRQKAQEAVHLQFQLRPTDFIIQDLNNAFELFFMKN